MRAFLAVELSDHLRGEIARAQSELKAAVTARTATKSRVTWTRPDTMHLTIKFLGDVDERQAAPLQQETRAAVDRRAALALPLARLGCFPRPEVPRVIWIGLDRTWEQSPAALDLAALVRDIEQRCIRFGVAAEPQKWHPHLTLARVRSGERPVGRALEATHAFDSVLTLSPLRIGAIVLMKSDLKPDGPVHSRLWQVDLAP